MRRTLLVTGGSGYLGSAVARRAGLDGWHVVATSYSQPGRKLDVTEASAVRDLVEAVRPRAIVHTAYRQGGPGAWSVIVDGSRHIADAAHLLDVRLVHLSTDVVFDGRLGRPYREDDAPSPLTEYGQAKTAAETAVRTAAPGSVIVRTSLMYGGPSGPPGKQERLAADLAATFYADELRCPVQVDDLAAALLELVELDVAGPLHVAGSDGLSRAEFAAMLADREVLSAPAPPGRPLDCRLDSSHAGAMLRTRLRGAREVLRH
jgi:dTDP-4-dehydrorhamnose reductase